MSGRTNSAGQRTKKDGAELQKNDGHVHVCSAVVEPKEKKPRTLPPSRMLLLAGMAQSNDTGPPSNPLGAGAGGVLEVWRQALKLEKQTRKDDSPSLEIGTPQCVCRATPT